jgi:hypothetical protein
MSPSQLSPLICDEGRVQCDRKGAGSKAIAACDALGNWASRRAGWATEREFTGNPSKKVTRSRQYLRYPL